MRNVQQSGLTLIELMISMVITSIAIGAALSMGFVMMDSYRDHKRSNGSERSARIALEYITDAVRNSAPGVNTGNVVDLATCEPFLNGAGPLGTTNGPIWVDNAPTGGGTTDAPDDLYLVYAAGGAVATLQEGQAGPLANFFDGETQFKVGDPASNVAGAAFAVDDYIMVTDFAVGHVMKLTGATLAAGQYTLNVVPCAPPGPTQWPPLGYVVADAVVIRVKIVRFFVDTANNILRVDDLGDGIAAQPLAEGIEDLQIAVGVDGDNNKSILELGLGANDDEWFYNFPGVVETAPTAGVQGGWRSLRITVTAVSTGESSAVLAGLRPGIEDRPVSSTPDNAKRRTLSTTIDVRNLAGSP